MSIKKGYEDLYKSIVSYAEENCKPVFKKDDEAGGDTHTKHIKSGSVEKTKANNVYDLAGNVAECTFEVVNSNTEIYRGGETNSESISTTQCPAAKRVKVVAHNDPYGNWRRTCSNVHRCRVDYLIFHILKMTTQAKFYIDVQFI